MLKKSAVCFMALTCAAAFTFVSAQLPWEIGYSSSESSSSDESSSDGGYSSYGSSSSSDDPYASSESVSSSDSSSNETAAETKPVKPKKEKKERAVKERVVPASFSAQKSCPVCNSTRIKRNLYVSHDGQRIHVCSAACKGRVKRNPTKSIEILEKRGESPEK